MLDLERFNGESNLEAQLRTEQKTAEEGNFSLTLFELFFACFDIALTL
jgi:hypothetical protein